MLENDIAIPLYSQLKDRIISAINNDELKYGEKIPTEIEIMERYLRCPSVDVPSYAFPRCASIPHTLFQFQN